MVKKLMNQQDYDDTIKEAGDKLVVIDFMATWCGPCKQIAPFLEETAKNMADKIVLVKVDVDEFEELTAQFGVTSMPTFVFMKNGEKVEQFAGANKDKVLDVIKKYTN